jgi:hypothetical protein
MEGIKKWNLLCTRICMLPYMPREHLIPGLSVYLRLSRWYYIPIVELQPLLWWGWWHNDNCVLLCEAAKHAAAQ